MTPSLMAPIAVLLLAWIAAGFRRPGWLERRTGIVDDAGNARHGSHI
jgi:hypothetical protein